MQQLNGNMTLRQAWPKIQANADELDQRINNHTADNANPHNVTAVQVGAETPMGAQEKADAVQANLESHIGSGGTAHAIATISEDGFMAAADVFKLSGIQAGAEVNQNTFSKITVDGQPDVDADAESASVKFVGGIGIAVTTDPVADTVTFTATSEAIPGAHASSHVTGGSDVIADAVAGVASGLMSGADKAVLDLAMTKGADNLAVNKVKAVSLEVDTRTAHATYTSNNLTLMELKDGAAVVKSTSLVYDADGDLESVAVTAGGQTVTTTLNYNPDGTFANYTKVVS